MTELVGPLGLDIFEQVRYIPNGVKMKLRFEKQIHPFVLMSALDNFKITPSPRVLMGHAQALMKANAKFPVTRTTCSVISVSAGHSTPNEDN